MMKNFRHAFTMVELIFVIVIIGILASVAMVTIAANRDDAMVTRGVSDVNQMVRDLSGYYIAKGEFGRWDEITNVKLDNKNNNKKSRYMVEEQRCIVFTRADEPGGIHIKINQKGRNRSTVCQSICDELIKQGIIVSRGDTTHMLGGTSIH